MKKLYAVTFSNEEPPHLCVAYDEGEARELALQRAMDLELSIGGELLVDFEGTYPDFDDFERHYSLRRNSYDPMAGLGGTLFGATGIEWDAVSQCSPSAVWTLLESEDLWWISPGFHFVNRLGYLLTNEERVGDEPDYLYE